MPTVRGLPWWGAVLLATVVTVIGAFIDSAPSGELGRTFKIIFIFGCVLAALAVRRRAMFTAAVQPPLVAFVVGLVVLYLEAGEAASDKKTLILKVVLPIATSFPWMLIALILSVTIVIARLFLTGPASKRPFGGLDGLIAKLTGKKTPARKPPGTKKPQETKTTGTAKSTGTKKPTRTTSVRPKRPSNTTPPAEDDSARSQGAKTTQRTPRPKPAGGPSTPSRRPRPKPAGTASDAPKKQPPAAAPAAMPSRAEPTADAKPTRRPRRPAPAEKPVEKKPQRAQPQKIPARQRRTAGQQLRERGQIEDLTAGLDD